MSPFLPTLFTVALVELGGANAQFSGSLVARSASPTLALRALAAISAVVMCLAAFGGHMLAAFEPMSARAGLLLLGMALMWSALSQFRALKPVAAIEGKSLSVIALRGFARIAMNGTAGLPVFAIGIYSGGSLDALLGAALGGLLGILVSSIPPLFFNRRQTRKMHIDKLRMIAGTVLALAGFYYALGALQLI